MDKPRDVVNYWASKLLANPEKLSGVSATFKFVVSGNDGGTWVVRCKPPVAVNEGEGEADCTVSVDAADFIALAQRKMNPQVAFMMGKIKLSGNVALALQLKDLF